MTRSKTPTKPYDFQTHRKALADIAERTRQLEAEFRRLEAQVAKARGTRRDLDSTPALLEHVAQMLTGKPLAFRDIMAALPKGTNENRVKGVLVRLQRDGHNLQNVGDGARALWFIRHAR